MPSSSSTAVENAAAVASAASAAGAAAASFPCRLELRVLFLTPAHAELAAAVLGVDEELQRERARRALRAEGRELVAELAAADARLLRITASSFLDMLGAQLRAMRDFA
jgi:hypothetical protein